MRRPNIANGKTLSMREIDDFTFMESVLMSRIQIQMVDNTVSADWWRALIRRFVKSGSKLELRCWKEETTEIQRASLYGKLVEDRNEVSVRGIVTDELLVDLLTEEPTDKSVYNKMTKYFTINVENELWDFSSAHYGTEIYIDRVLEDDVSFVSKLFRQYADRFSIYIAE